MDKNYKCRPPCYIYDGRIGKWQAFKNLILSINEREFFRYTNSAIDLDNTIHKKITFEYIVYFSRIIPKDARPESYSSNLQAAYASQNLTNVSIIDNLDINSIIVLEDMSRRHLFTTEEDQYILLGFDIDNPIYEEDNLELKYIRDLIAAMHKQLKYSEDGLIYQVTQRLHVILQKVLKSSLAYIASLFNISLGTPLVDKLRHLHLLSYEPAFQEYLKVIFKESRFMNEMVSLTYKVIGVIGLFPVYIELNTMNEPSVWLKVKHMLTNFVNAPYGSRHHASFSIGNFRYSFIYVKGDKERQRVYVTSDLKRVFYVKNHANKYFRVKFFDFFPMDSWVEKLANRIMSLLPAFFHYLIELPPESFEDFKETWRNFFEKEAENSLSVCEQIAKEFYYRYKSDLDDTQTNEKTFKKITQVIADADVRGYKDLTNNCQTVVSEIIMVLGARIQKIVDHLCDISQLPACSNTHSKDLVKEFLKFGSEFNYSFSHIAPFPLMYRISYFDTFSDKDTCELLFPKNYDNMQKCLKDFKNRPNVQKFLLQLEEGLQLASTIHIIRKSKPLNEEERKYPDIDFKKGVEYSVVSCLMNLIYNEIFNIRREIKIAKESKELFDEEMESIEQGRKKKPHKEIKKWQTLAGKMASLYEEKYKLLDFYKELCFYYYNTVRLGAMIKLSDNTSCFGFLITKKPDFIMKASEEKEDKTEEIKLIKGSNITQ